ncbi:MAG: hypothetical protein Tsb004_30490 [Allomuricauda sp.]
MEKYPELSEKSMLSQLERNRNEALSCYLSDENKYDFILIEIERYPNGDFDRMNYLSYFNAFDDNIYSCNYSKKPKFIDDSREKTIDSIISLVKNKKLEEIQELSSDVKNSISDSGIIYITVHEKGKVSEVLKVDEFFIEDELGIPEGFKG